MVHSSGRVKKCILPAVQQQWVEMTPAGNWSFSIFLTVFSSFLQQLRGVFACERVRLRSKVKAAAAGASRMRHRRCDSSPDPHSRPGSSGSSSSSVRHTSSSSSSSVLLLLVVFAASPSPPRLPHQPQMENPPPGSRGRFCRWRPPPP